MKKVVGTNRYLLFVYVFQVVFSLRLDLLDSNLRMMDKGIERTGMWFFFLCYFFGGEAGGCSKSNIIFRGVNQMLTIANKGVKKHKNMLTEFVKDPIP